MARHRNPHFAETVRRTGFRMAHQPSNVPPPTPRSPTTDRPALPFAPRTGAHGSPESLTEYRRALAELVDPSSGSSRKQSTPGGRRSRSRNRHAKCSHPPGLRPARGPARGLNRRGLRTGRAIDLEQIEVFGKGENAGRQPGPWPAGSRSAPGSSCTSTAPHPARHAGNARGRAQPVAPGRETPFPRRRPWPGSGALFARPSVVLHGPCRRGPTWVGLRPTPTRTGGTLEPC
jgi:hypothetical protein